MKIKPVILGGSILLSLSLVLSGCTNDAAVPTPSISSAPVTPSTSEPAPTTAPIEPPTPVDVSRGELTDAEYAQLQSEVAVMPIRDLKSNAAALENQYGKPVGIVVHYTCPSATDGVTTGWGVSGAFAGNSNDPCGTGNSASQESATEMANNRASRAGLAPGEFIIVVVEMLDADAS